MREGEKVSEQGEERQHCIITPATTAEERLPPHLWPFLLSHSSCKLDRMLMNWRSTGSL